MHFYVLKAYRPKDTKMKTVSLRLMLKEFEHAKKKVLTLLIMFANNFFTAVPMF